MLRADAPFSLIRLRPRDDAIYASQSRTVLAAERDGFICDGQDHGLFVHQTRLLSRYRWLIDGQPPQPVALSNVEQHSWLGYYITLAPGIDPGSPDKGSGGMSPVSQQTLELRLSRFVGNGFHEDVDLTNFTQKSIQFRLELEAEADFADLVETKQDRQQQGTLDRSWQQTDEGHELVFDYAAEHHFDVQGNEGTARIQRALALRIKNPGAVPEFIEGKIRFEVALGPLETWHACIEAVPTIEDEPLPLLSGCRSFETSDTEFDRKRQIFLGEATRFSTAESGTLAPTVLATVDQAVRDLAALRLCDLDKDERAWVPAAGLPIYIAMFGRDTLTASWQAGLIRPDPLRGTLAELAQRQGSERNDWRDEPGRMLHEAHTGPLAALRYNPRSGSYSSITTSGFYPVVVAELWHWTGDKELVRPFLQPALDALRAVERDCERFDSPFHTYKTRSEQGVRNQAWKDSDDAIVYEDGSEVHPPIATCEEQGFVYLARLNLAEVLWWLDEKDESKRLYREAGELKKRFNDSFWMEDRGFYAMGLDGAGRQIRSIGSNPGHCLATGIVEHDLAQRTADRLVAPDLFSGWGIRTLSAEHPAYNPYSYHRGSVWPVEQGTFALGFMRYGLHDHVEKICRAQFEAAALFQHHRLPELFSGHVRDAVHPFPAFYPQANSPQAWSATCTFSMLQALLGIYPYAPLRMLLLDPHLPEWLPEITLSNLRVGDAAATIRFYRKSSGASSYEVLDKRGSLHVLRQPSPWSLTATLPERLIDGLASLLPGK